MARLQECNRWYEVKGGRVMREPGGWYSVELPGGKVERGCEYDGFHFCVVGLSEKAAKVLARAVGGSACITESRRSWVVNLGLGTEGEMAQLSDEIGGLDD